MIRFLVLLTFCFLSAGHPGGAAELPPAGAVITIENVELRETGGRWVSVIRPDKQVDLKNERASVSFFNNQGRVPAGRYDSFKITYVDPLSGKRSLYPAQSLERPLEVKKGSFVNVSFDFNPTEESQPLRVIQAAVTVDDRTETMEDLQWS